MNTQCSRRTFLTQCSLMAVGAGIGTVSLPAACSPQQPEDPPKKPPGKMAIKAIGPTVVDRTDKKVFEAGGHNQRRARELVQRSVADLVGVNDPTEAFRALFDPKDVVAIKPNCLAGPGMSSSVAVVNALVSSLRAIGIPYKNIIIWERTIKEMTMVGFRANRYGNSLPICVGNDEAGFERELQISGKVGSLWTNVLANKATALINVPVLKDHDLSGVGCAMKNMYGAIHNPNRYHDNNCDPYVADVSNHPYIKDKLRLIVTDALTAQYHGGPAKVLTHQWKPAQILTSTDPVAMDTVAKQILEQKRKQKGLATFEESKRPPKWLKTAKKQGLGEADPEKIKRIQA